MFMILPTRDSSAAAANEVLPEETFTRIKKACNRCRIKRSKCNGRILCARCKGDKVVCRADVGLADRKEMSRRLYARYWNKQSYKSTVGVGVGSLRGFELMLLCSRLWMVMITTAMPTSAKVLRLGWQRVRY
ncbi:hypothetical protein K505DRAFT_321292 [Melanomma pulvis-pyrius CBS 109.77]|uniref:Zn(2)-C6 fungal-type domain-containing protein n=1 Tax=Melanomma pulvis-pyrius CBS 109.77 TaxID=1314802 RepID=A0A6A6XS37_9PLEO|nr:hypothetical protein K505DRAFT_321292 [Melanomma pulvis-pyrius CBS 109.77]